MKLILASIGLVAACGTSIPPVAAYACPSSTEDLTAIEQKIRLAVPIGSTAHAAEMHLKTCRIAYTNVPKSKVIYAIINNIRGKGVVPEAASIRIFYDENGTVSKIEIFSSFL